MTNAFYSISGVDTTHEDKFGFYKKAILHVLDIRTTVLRASDETGLLSAGCGVLPGLHKATNMLNSANGDALRPCFGSATYCTDLLQPKSPIDCNKHAIRLQLLL